MSRNLTGITNQNTFGVWKTRTNDIIAVLSDVVTIGDSETNLGNIAIDGNITSTGTLFVDTLQETSGSGTNTISVNANLGVEGNLILDQTVGLATSIAFQSANSTTWSIETSADHTTLDIKKGIHYLRITDGGSLTGSADLTIDADLFPTSGDPIALDTTGNAATATAWASGRTITLTGDVSATSTAFDGSSDLSFAVTVDGDEVTIPNANVTGLGALLDAKAALAGAVFTGDVTIPASQYLFFGKTASDTDGYASIRYNASRELFIQMVDGSNASTPTAGIKIDLAAKNLIINNGSTGKIQFSSANGNIVTVGDITAFGTVSDRNRKENIVKIENALDKVSQISGYTFNYIGDDTPMTGVIAQELEEVLPEVVYETESVDGTQSKAVRHGNIVGLLIESIKELKAEIEELKKEK
tara:strand:- start:4522 stop:5766 length:1245 start_codon:yes stop_codon:yes gene_type:complete